MYQPSSAANLRVDSIWPSSHSTSQMRSLTSTISGGTPVLRSKCYIRVVGSGGSSKERKKVQRIAIWVRYNKVQKDMKRDGRTVVKQMNADISNKTAGYGIVVLSEAGGSRSTPQTSWYHTTCTIYQASRSRSNPTTNSLKVWGSQNSNAVKTGSICASGAENRQIKSDMARSGGRTVQWGCNGVALGIARGFCSGVGDLGGWSFSTSDLANK